MPKSPKLLFPIYRRQTNQVVYLHPMTYAVYMMWACKAAK